MQARNTRFLQDCESSKAHLFPVSSKVNKVIFGEVCITHAGLHHLQCKAHRCWGGWTTHAPLQPQSRLHCLLQQIINCSKPSSFTSLIYYKDKWDNPYKVLNKVCGPQEEFKCWPALPLHHWLRYTVLPACAPLPNTWTFLRPGHIIQPMGS